MRGYLISRVYLTKCLGLVLIFGFIAMGAIGGCNTNGGGPRAITENDFAEAPALFANPENDTVVTFLEHPGAGEEDNQTGEIGVDIIPYRYQSDTNATFCFEDDNDDAEHFAILFDSEGNEVLRVLANSECATEFILAGRYFLEIVHDGLAQDILPIFAIPGQNGEQAANNIDTDQGLFKSVKTRFSEFVNDLRDIVTQNAKAQTPSPSPSPVQNNVSILLNTKECKQCLLTGANLVNAPLSGADLRSAILLNANMSGADLTNANLSSSGVDQTILCGAILTSANLTNSNLCGAALLGNQCTQLNTPGATIEDTTFDGATWVTSDCMTTERPCMSPGGGPELTSVIGGQGTAVTCELSTDFDSIDMSPFFNVCNKGSTGQCNLITEDTKMMIQAWGGFGGAGGCSEGNFLVLDDVHVAEGGYAQTITTLRDLVPMGVSVPPILFYYIGANGDNEDLSIFNSAGGGSSTVVIPNGPITEPVDNPLVIAGGGGGSGTSNCSAVSFSCGGNGGTAIATTSSADFFTSGAVGSGQGGGVANQNGNCPICLTRSGNGGNLEGGGGGTSADGTVASKGLDTIGGFGGCSGAGCNPKGWLNSSLTFEETVKFDIGTGGSGGSGQTPDTGCPGGGGGGGLGGGGAGSRIKAEIFSFGISGAGGGGGSFGLQSTETCASAPTSRPTNPNSKGTARIVFFNNSDC